MSTDRPSVAEPADRRAGDALRRVGELALAVVGGAVSLAGGLLLGLYALLLVPWRVEVGASTVRVPAAVALAVGGALLLLWYAPRVVGSRWAVLLPFAGWLAMAGPAAVTSTVPSASGDRLLMPDDALAAVTLFAGTAVLVVGVTLAVTGGRPVGRPGRSPGVPGGRGVTRPSPGA